jgi:hypothetical protein
MNCEFDIAMLLATRGRTESLDRSVRSLVEMADNPDRLQLMFAFDNDDKVGTEYFKTELQPWLDAQDLSYTAMQFERQGYHRLHVYNNKMAEYADAHWMMIWNDDAVMQTHGWDTEIMNRTGQFKLLAFRTHLDHPYSIFPIVPCKWYQLLGHISPHSAQDAWVSQQAYVLDIFERIPVWVLHDRADLTGNNNDKTYQERVSMERNPNQETDFHHESQIKFRMDEAAKLATYMWQQGISTEFFQNALKGTQDPWEKLKENDTNKQMVQFKNAHEHFAR